MARKELEKYDPMIRGSLEDALDGIDAIEEIIETDVPRVSEDFFKSTMLPVLTSTSKRNSINIWLDVAGSPQRSIDVVDDEGKVLFRTPPLLRKISPKRTNSGKTSIYDIMSVAEMKTHTIPKLGMKHIEENLIKTLEHIPVDIKALERWNGILLKYGYKPLIETTNTQEPSSATIIATDKSKEVPFTGDFDDL